MGYTIALVGKQFYSAAVSYGGGNPVFILTNSLPDAQIGVAYSATLTAQGGTPPIVWSVIVGSLPAGLSLNSITGVISGTPTGPVGLDTFTIQALDGPGTGSDKISGTL